MRVAERYRTGLDSGAIEPDPLQQPVIEALDALATAMQRPSARRSLWRRARPVPVRGVYLWGGVGRGKTWLMDLFFYGLPDDASGPGKTRLHFHQFMQDVHEALRAVQGRSEPLQHVARSWAKRTRLLCLDEFAVTDIGDAMILAGLLRALFAEGVTLVTTSNVPPEDLYQDGIQRASFLPAIALLERHTRVLQLGGGRDYRRRILEDSAVYHQPLGRTTEEGLWREFERLATGEIERGGEVAVMGRAIPFRARAGGVVWFDFEALCGPPRSRSDYLEVARCHHTVFLSDIPILDGSRDDRSRRFIFSIDEFYDRRVKMVLSAAVGPERLYCGERLAFEFQRTASRLIEMQNATYLGQPHRG